MVMEGVHLVPGMLPPVEGALVVQFVLSIEDVEEHASHFWIRDHASEGVRPSERYLDSIGHIRTIQDFIVERAHRHGVRVIDNADVEMAIAAAMSIVLDSAEQLEAVG